MMEELYFGVPRVGSKVVGPYGRKLTVRKNRTGRKYIEYTSKRTGNKARKYLESSKSSPIRKTKSPKRVKKMCSKTMSLAKLRKLANEHGVSVLSMAKRRMNKRTGELVKPKLIGCSALKKRLKEAGLERLYKSIKIIDDKSDAPMIAIMERTFGNIPLSLQEDLADIDEVVVEDEPVLQYPGVHEIDAAIRKRKKAEAKAAAAGVEAEKAAGKAEVKAEKAAEKAEVAVERAQAAPDDEEKRDKAILALQKATRARAEAKAAAAEVETPLLLERTHPRADEGWTYAPDGSEVRDPNFVAPTLAAAEAEKPAAAEPEEEGVLADVGRFFGGLFGGGGEEPKPDGTSSFGVRIKTKPVARTTVNGRVKNLYRGAQGGFFYLKQKGKKVTKVYVSKKDLKKRK